MKKNFHIVIIMLLMFNACTKKELEVIPTLQLDSVDKTWLRYPLDTTPVTLSGNSSRISATYPLTSYVSVPDNKIFLPPPATAVTYNNFTYYGGPFQSSCYSITGSTITFQLKRTDGFAFPVNSVLKIKRNNAGGSIVASVNLSTATTTYNISTAESNTWNIVGSTSSNSNNTDSYVATWYNPVSGYTFYTQAIKIIAVPTGWGAYLASLQNVNVYSNGWGGFSATNNLRDASVNNSQKYQCVHYIQKYYLALKSRNIGNANAGDYWNSYTSHNLTQRITNGAGIPQQGDIICFQRSSTEYHVGIVNGVSSTGRLRIFEENVGQTLVNGNYCSGYKDFSFTSSGSGYNVSASLLGTGWTTLGWVR